jgi:hypothetical protein
MANETYSLNMLKRYDAQYILVFDTFDYQGNWADWAGGDNGKWTWMADISGSAQQRFIDTGFIDQGSSWQNDSSFGQYNSTTNQWDWNSTGVNTAVYKLMSWGKYEWCVTNSVSDPNTADASAQPTYFTEEFFSGLTLTPSEAESNYGGVVPLVCLYKIDWQLYYQDYPNA